MSCHHHSAEPISLILLLLLFNIVSTSCISSWSESPKYLKYQKNVRTMVQFDMDQDHPSQSVGQNRGLRHLSPTGSDNTEKSGATNSHSNLELTSSFIYTFVAQKKNKHFKVLDYWFLSFCR